jgi:hypothetical protein
VLQLREMFENKCLFENIYSSDGMYDCRSHLAQMIALLGHPPKELLDRGRDGCSWNWTPVHVFGRGWCTSVEGFFGGPFFDSNGKKFRDYTSVNSVHITILTA